MQGQEEQREGSKHTTAVRTCSPNASPLMSILSDPNHRHLVNRRCLLSFWLCFLLCSFAWHNHLWNMNAVMQMVAAAAPATAQGMEPVHSIHGKGWGVPLHRLALWCRALCSTVAAQWHAGLSCEASGYQLSCAVLRQPAKSRTCQSVSILKGNICACCIFRESVVLRAPLSRWAMLQELRDGRRRCYSWKGVQFNPEAQHFLVRCPQRDQLGLPIV